MKTSLTAGLTVTRRVVIQPEQTISFMGEALRVYSTPAMLSDMEYTCRDLILGHLDSGEDTVGVHVELDHLGATFAGMWVDITATVTGVEGRRVSLEITAHDALEQVGGARHVRAVVDTERHAGRLAAKAARAG